MGERKVPQTLHASMGYRLGGVFGSGNLSTLGSSAHSSWIDTKKASQDESLLGSTYKASFGRTSTPARSTTPSASLRLAAVSSLAQGHSGSTSRRFGNSKERLSSDIKDSGGFQVLNCSANHSAPE